MNFILEFNHLPGPINLNSPSKWGRRHARATLIHRMVKEMLDERVDRPQEPFINFELHFMFHRPDLIERDLENLRAGCKVYVDALVKEKVLAGDSMKYVHRDVQEWDLRRGSPGFTLTITSRE